MNLAAAPSQRGAALVVMLALIGVVAGALLLRVSKAATDRTERDRITALALGRAVEALVARAATDGNRPGSLPCPDTDNDGIADGGGLCSGPPHIGRLPWATLDLPDLRDGDGERLWYVLSPAFRDHSLAGPPVSSNTLGQLQVTGIAPAANAIAIVFAPGTTLGNQNRDSAGQNTVANYLEGENANGDATYSNGLRTDAFNDQLLVLSVDDLMPAVERRVAREAKACLMKYAAANAGRFPFAAPLGSVFYDDAAGTLAGRLPRIVDDSGSTWTGHSVTWPSSTGPVTTPCLGVTTWWDRWRDLLFYQVAAPFAPGGSGVCTTDCLVVNGAPSVQAVVVVAGRAFASNPAQTGRPSSNAADYLETDPVSLVNNATAASTLGFARMPSALTATANFNDKVECILGSGAWPCGN